MKKIIIALFFAPFMLLAQTPYYDALVLERYGTVVGNKFQIAVTNDNRAVIYEIFRRYVDSNNIALEDAINVVSENPFISITGTSHTTVQGTGIGSLVGAGLGGLDVTTLTQGLAAFLVDRTKEELNVAFFSRLKDLLDAYPEFKTLFPHTKVFIDGFEAWNYANVLSTLREAFNKDLKDILKNLIELRKLTTTGCSDLKGNTKDDCENRIKDVNAFLHSNGGLALLSALQIGNSLTQGNKVPDVINSITHTDFLLGFSFADASTKADFDNSVGLLNIFSLSLKSNDVNRHYLSNEEFSKLLSLPATNVQRLYFGLLYQHIFNAKIVIKGTDVAKAMRTSTAATQEYVKKMQDYIAQLKILADNLQVAYDGLIKGMAEGKADLGLEYGALLSSAQRFLQGAGNIVLLDATFTYPDRFREIMELSGSVLQIVQDVKAKNYNGALMEVITLVSQQIEKARIDGKDQDLYPYSQQFISSLLKYGSFAANVVNSKGPDEVKEAIRAIALPSGSSSIKKVSSFNVAVNAYVGFVWGKEKPLKDSYVVTQGDSTKTVKLNGGKAVAVYAPIGITLSTGLGWKECKNPGSISLFLSFIDIGAMVGYRFTNDSTFSGAPKVKLANIFSPGANIVFGIPRVPISIGFGIQRVATFQRDPSTNELYNVDFSALRKQVFLAVDIPLANLYNGKKGQFHAKTIRKKK